MSRDNWGTQNSSKTNVKQKEGLAAYKLCTVRRLPNDEDIQTSADRYDGL